MSPTCPVLVCKVHVNPREGFPKVSQELNKVFGCIMYSVVLSVFMTSQFLEERGNCGTEYCNDQHLCHVPLCLALHYPPPPSPAFLIR